VYYDLACQDALERKRNAGFQNLGKAVAMGFQDIRHLRRDADLRSLRRDARWKPMLAKIRRAGAMITTVQKHATLVHQTARSVQKRTRLVKDGIGAAARQGAMDVREAFVVTGASRREPAILRSAARLP
jgi:hypothetical protein